MTPALGRSIGGNVEPVDDPELNWAMLLGVVLWTILVLGVGVWLGWWLTTVLR